ncbi:MAG: tetratricopeptide repeat protein [Bryobacteraceae bacterium]
MLTRWTAIFFLVLLINTAYIAANASATIFYMANVLLHVLLGLVLAGAFLVLVGRRPELRRTAFAVLPAAALGLYLTVRGTTYDNRGILLIHIVLGLIGVALVGIAARGEWRKWLVTVTVCGLVYVGASALWHRIAPNPDDRIRNPEVVPVSMEGEGAGPQSPFWPSSANTNVNGVIPSDFFMDSKLCAECHKDIYDQWNSSAHHFASFNNQFYRKSIEQMQELGGLKGSKWCAGCHDHAVFFNGRFDKPISEQIDTPEARNGLGCVSCHSISKVAGTMGNGGFTIEYPPLHELASSRNPWIRKLDRFLTYLDPEPHRRTFLKPFMREDQAEFCSNCHKVHLDVPVNNYRWLRGFNDYDNWQASGVSGQGARSFYYPAEPATCGDCHMQKVASRDAGNRDGQVHSHRFAAANTALAYVNKDAEQLDEVKKFLQSGFITVDIFAASPVDESRREAQMVRRAGEGPQLMSTFAVGEEAEQGGPVFLREVGNVAAPLDRVGTKFAPGSTVRVDVAVRTRKVGHFFPGGTVDAFDIWLEVEARDSKGRTIFHSGAVDEDGRGAVDKGAHFYRSYMLDGAGNPVDKRNAWQARSVLYVRLIPPGAADVAHYRLAIPKDAEGAVTVEAKLHYRKFSHYYTKYSYAGKAVSGEATKEHDSREYNFDAANIPANVSGEIKGEIPEIPIVTLASAKASLAIGSGAADWKPVVEKRDRERWNDWGIGMLLQGDLKGAQYAFERVMEAEPEYADGWINMARALIQEGQTEAAKPYLARALEIGPNLGRAHFFQAMAHKADGDYDAALASLARVTALYPRDRVVLNQVGRLEFLKRNYAASVEALRAVLAIDPEDVQAHYNLMLAYRGLGEIEKAQQEEQLFRRFKADEASQTLTAKARMLSPEDNNERQAIHEHDSLPTRAPQ